MKFLKDLINKIKMLWKKRKDTDNTNNTDNTDNTDNTENNNKDMIDVNTVTWLHTNVKDWDITFDLRDVKVNGSKVILDFDYPTDWGEQDINGTMVVGNPWVFVNKNNKWYGATWEWLRKNQKIKNLSSLHGSHIKKSPLTEWEPISGEEYGFMISGLARDSKRNVKERSNILLKKW